MIQLKNLKSGEGEGNNENERFDSKFCRCIFRLLLKIENIGSITGQTMINFNMDDALKMIKTFDSVSRVIYPKIA